MRKPDRKRHEVWRVVTCVSEHHSLVACTLAVEDVFTTHTTALFFTLVDALSNVDTLCVESYKNATGVAVETVCGVVVADAINGRASDSWDINVCIGGDFTRDNTQTGGEQCLTSNAAVGVLLENGIEN